MKYKLVYNMKDCIGAGECEKLFGAIWKVQNNGKAVLKGAVLNQKTGKYELEIDETDLKKHQQVAGSCPVGCIKVEKM